jgi:hypothetical protein
MQLGLEVAQSNGHDNFCSDKVFQVQQQFTRVHS